MVVDDVFVLSDLASGMKQFMEHDVHSPVIYVFVRIVMTMAAIYALA